MESEPHDQLALPSSPAFQDKEAWEELPTVDARLEPVFARIRELKEAGLTSAMVVADFVRRLLAPLQKRGWAAWMYTGDNDFTRLHVGAEGNLSPAMFRAALKALLDNIEMPMVELPQGVLALCSDPRRDAIWKTLPDFNTMGLLTLMRRLEPGTLRISGCAGGGVADARAAAGGDNPKGKGKEKKAPTQSPSPSPPPLR